MSVNGDESSLDDNKRWIRRRLCVRRYDNVCEVMMKCVYANFLKEKYVGLNQEP